MHNALLVLARVSTTIQILNTLMFLLLGSAVLITVVSTTTRAVWLLIAQSLVLATVSIVSSLVSHDPSLYISVAATLVVKAVVVPIFILRALRRAAASDAGPMYLGRRNVFIAAIALIFFAFALVHPITIADTLVTNQYFPAAVAMILVGCLTMMVRKKALVQVIGLIVVENGVYAASLATTFGLPPIVELGIISDLLVTILLLSVLTYQIGLTTATLDTSQLRRLRH